MGVGVDKFTLVLALTNRKRMLYEMKGSIASSHVRRPWPYILKG